jgi:uncharacterized membrane protein YuzA (DUF378 family)
MFNVTGCCKSKCIPALIIKVLLVVGGINWGLYGVGMLMSNNWNVVNLIFGNIPTLEAIIYILVGVAAIVKILGCKCKKCVEVCSSCGTDEKVDVGM